MRILALLFSTMLVVLGCQSPKTFKKASPVFTKNLEETSTPKAFFEGVVSQDSTVQWNNTFSADGATLIYTIAQKGKPSYLVEHQWLGQGFSPPKKVISDGQFPYTDPHLSMNGNKVVFSSARGFFDGDTTKRNFHLWQAEKANGTWEKPIRISGWGGFENGLFYPGWTAKGDLYFSHNDPENDGGSNIYVARKKGAGYAVPHKLPATINSPKQESDAFIDQQERFLIFAGFEREENYGKSDLYISFRDGETWSEPQNLGPEINSHGFDGSPYVTRDNQFLIFTSSRAKDGSDGEDFFNVFYVSFNLKHYQNTSS